VLTNKQTPLKTSTSLHYAMPVDKYSVQHDSTEGTAIQLLNSAIMRKISIALLHYQYAVPFVYENVILLMRA